MAKIKVVGMEKLQKKLKKEYSNGRREAPGEETRRAVADKGATECTSRNS